MVKVDTTQFMLWIYGFQGWPRLWKSKATAQPLVELYLCLISLRRFQLDDKVWRDFLLAEILPLSGSRNLSHAISKALDYERYIGTNVLY